MSEQTTKPARRRTIRIPFALGLFACGLLSVVVGHLITPGPSLPNALGYYALGFAAAAWGLRK